MTTTRYTTAGSHNLECPAGVTSVEVRCWGGGGGGGAGDTANGWVTCSVYQDAK